jgi:hypothetical protein
MPTLDEVKDWTFFLIMLSAFGFLLYLRYNPNSRLRKGVEAFWKTPAIKQFRIFIWKVFWVLFLGWIAVVSIQYYFTDSGWYPREKEVDVFFKAHEWIDGEIQTCYSAQFTTPKTADTEIATIACSFDPSESHVLRVKFWGPIRADRNKVWKCERSQSAMTCRLQ